ncbi:hypothetical protein K2X33_09290, partial [bacterium]|nr:hypothetical protein [bacterium]
YPEGVERDSALVFGHQLANALHRWAEDKLKRKRSSRPKPAATVAFYNRFSYGWPDLVEPLFKEPVTRAAFRRALHYTGELRLIMLTAAQLQELYTALRHQGKRSPQPYRTPLLGGPFKESPSGQLLVQVGGRWNKLSPGEIYAVALDHWIGANGFRNPVVEKILSKAQWESSKPEINTVLAEFFDAGSCLRQIVRSTRVETRRREFFRRKSQSETPQAEAGE